MGREHSAGPAYRAIVDATAIRDNFRRCVQWAGGADVMGVVKAGGYGHGALAAARAALADLGWVDGIELPFREDLDAPEPWLAEQLAGRFDQCVITAIPGTMGRAGANPVFGLASPDDDGRAQALAYTCSLLEAVDRLHEAAGERLVARVELHSAPHHQATPEAFHASLSELSEDFASRGLGMIVEHDYLNGETIRMDGAIRMAPR